MLVRARSACGFSLIELLLVVCVLAVAAAFGLPALEGTMTAYRLRASADVIAGELDAARVMAISRGAEYQVTFTGTAVAVVDPLDTAHPPRAPKNLDPGVDITSGPTITFRPRGTCTGGVVQLQDTKLNGASITVTTTGKTTVYLTGSTSSD